MATLTQQQLERHLWGAGDILRSTMDAGDYKQYISGADAKAVDVAAEVDPIARRDEAEAVMFGYLRRLGYVG